VLSEDRHGLILVEPITSSNFTGNLLFQIYFAIQPRPQGFSLDVKIGTLIFPILTAREKRPWGRGCLLSCSIFNRKKFWCKTALKCSKSANKRKFLEQLYVRLLTLNWYYHLLTLNRYYHTFIYWLFNRYYHTFIYWLWTGCITRSFSDFEQVHKTWYRQKLSNPHGFSDISLKDNFAGWQIYFTDPLIYFTDQIDLC